MEESKSLPVRQETIDVCGSLKAFSLVVRGVAVMAGRLLSMSEADCEPVGTHIAPRYKRAGGCRGVPRLAPPDDLSAPE